jgi:DNA-directed RNA polymerase subunit H (RpoH/RPB5)
MDVLTAIKNATTQVTTAKSFPESTKARQVLTAVKVDPAKHVLMVDGTKNITRLSRDDPVNKYFGGNPGDVYRIEDRGTIRYRIVYNVNEKGSQREKPSAGQSPTDDPAVTYRKALSTVYQMIQDRRYQAAAAPGVDLDDTANMTITATRDGKKRLYVVFLDPTNDHMLSKKLIMDEDFEAIFERVKTDIPALPEFDFSDETTIDSSAAEYGKHASVIVVYNNPRKKTSSIATRYANNPLLHFYSVQDLQFNIMRHVMQPKFTLLDLNVPEEREEIFELFKMQGTVLDLDKTLAENNAINGGECKLLVFPQLI